MYKMYLYVFLTVFYFGALLVRKETTPLSRSGDRKRSIVTFRKKWTLGLGQNQRNPLLFFSLMSLFAPPRILFGGSVDVVVLIHSTLYYSIYYFTRNDELCRVKSLGDAHLVVLQWSSFVPMMAEKRWLRGGWCNVALRSNTFSPAAVREEVCVLSIYAPAGTFRNK
jgi:hypothetical protein